MLPFNWKADICFPYVFKPFLLTHPIKSNGHENRTGTHLSIRSGHKNEIIDNNASSCTQVVFRLTAIIVWKMALHETTVMFPITAMCA